MKNRNSMEDYLSSILILHRRKGYARSTDIADELGVSKPTVCATMKRLREKQLIFYGDKGYIFLTETGKAIAEKEDLKQTLVRKILVGLGVNEKNAARDACYIGHVISDETYECLHMFFHSHLSSATSDL